MQVLQVRYGLEQEELWPLATAFGSGMSRRGFVCGAVSGGIIACGLVTAHQLGTTRESRRELRERSYSRVQELTRRFEEKFGSVECRAMVGCDFLTPEGQATFKERHLMDRVCRPAVQFVTEAMVEILDRKL